MTNEERREKLAEIFGQQAEYFEDWFAPEDFVGTAELIIPRSTIPISGTMVRGMLVIDDETNWQKATHPLIHGMYNRLRTELMSVPVYKEIYDHIRTGDMTLENFMKVYKDFEARDKEQKLAHLNKT